MTGIASVLYGVVAYLIFLASFLYAIAFVGNLQVPKTMDRGEPGAIGAALAINILLLGLFAIQHSVMARPAFKRWWTRYVPQPVERSHLCAARGRLTLVLLFWQWRPMPDMVWSVTIRKWRDDPAPAGHVLDRLGRRAPQHLPHQSFRAVWLAPGRYDLWRPDAATAVFRTPLITRVVRHPIYLGFLHCVLGAPTMTRAICCSPSRPPAIS